MAESIALNCDCMEYMRTLPDNAFDLAVVDPPYGDASCGEADDTHTHTHSAGVESLRPAIRQVQNGRGGICRGGKPSIDKRERERERDGARHGQGKNCRKPDGTWGYANWRDMGDEVRKKIIEWDVAPKQEYFAELFRVSRNQVIWGGNYFPLPPTRCFLIWRKLTISESFSMAMAEYAWTSFNSNAKVFEYAPQDTTRFHPTQKPVALYRWIYQLYASEGMKILDTHLGSGSSRIAAYDAGLDFVGCEIDKVYFDKQEERFSTHAAQQNLFLM